VVRVGGFTLLELLVVLTIVGVAFSLVLPALGSGLSHWQLQGAVREVATILKFTRNQAVERRMSLQVILDRARGVYWLDNAEAPVLSDPEQAVEKGIRLYALPTGVRFGEVTTADPVVEGDRIGIFFFPRGNSTGGEVQLHDPKGRTYWVRVEPLTGRASVHR
jgi:prepilin-type N-terminal cleavage/methylation domain-containing protein